MRGIQAFVLATAVLNAASLQAQQTRARHGVCVAVQFVRHLSDGRLQLEGRGEALTTVLLPKGAEVQGVITGDIDRSRFGTRQSPVGGGDRNRFSHCGPIAPAGHEPAVRERTLYTLRATGVEGAAKRSGPCTGDEVSIRLLPRASMMYVRC